MQAFRARRALSTAVICAIGVLGIGMAPSARAAPPPNLRVAVTCDTAVGPGRVRCSAETTVSDGEIRWADVELVRVPSFITPLKGRLAPSDGVRRSNESWQFGFAVVAKDRGTGPLLVRGRAVACRGAVCMPVQAEASVELQVGT